MNNDSDNSTADLDAVEELVDRVCDEFESAWLANRHARIEDYVRPDDDPIDSVLLQELLIAEWELRADRQMQVGPTGYMERFPQQAPSIETWFLRWKDARGREGPDRVSEDCGEDRDVKSPGGSKLSVRCPHCQHLLDVNTETSFAEIICSVCDSRFSIVGDQPNPKGVQATRLLGHFELVERLGTGAFGTVWRAHDTKLDREVAVKIPRTGQLESSAVEDFLREARMAAQLRHPNIVSVHEVGRDGDTAYIVSDLVRGIPLSDSLTGQRYAIREAVQLCQTLARALHYSHEKGVVHRDLKPHNIIVDEDGDPHLMDFGLARREVGEMTVTMDGQVLGTPAYMSPEQARGDAHQADRRTDVYSLGVILFQLLTSELPFRGNTRMLLHQVLHDEPTSPRRLNQQVPRDLETICLKCLEKDPARRLATAADVSDELGRFLVGHPVHSRPVSALQRAGRWCKRNPMVSGLATGLVLTLVIGLLTVTSQWLRADRNASRVIRQSVELAQDRGLTLCEQGKIDRGMLWLARSLQLAPDDARDMRHVIRANLAAYRNELHAVRLMVTHPCAVHSLALTTDGNRILTGGNDGVVRVWDSESGARFDSSMKHESKVMCLAISPDGSRIVAGTTDGGFLWDAGSGQLIRRLQEQDSGVMSVVFNPAGDRFATGSWDGGQTVCLWDSTSGEPLRTPLGKHRHAVSSLAFSPDGQRIVSGSWDKSARLWRVDSGEPIGKPLEHETWVWALNFTDDGARLAAGCDDGSVHLWDLGSYEKVWISNTHEARVRALAVSPDGRRVLTGSEDNTARIWDVRTGQQMGPTLNHQATVMGAGFSSLDGQVLVTVSLDCTARIWQRSPPRHPRQAIRHPGTLLTCAISPDGRRVISGGEDNRAHVWDVTTGLQLTQPLRHNEWVVATAFSPDGSLLLTAMGSGDATRLWEAGTGKLIQDFGPSTGGCLAFSPDSGKAAAVSQGVVRCWETSNGREIPPPIGSHDDLVHALAFGPKGKRIVTACEDRMARLWDVATGKQIGDPLPHHGPVRAVAWSQNGSLLVTGCEDETARLWDPATQSPVGKPLEHEARVSAVAASPDGHRVLTGSWDKTARLWDAATGKPVGPAYRHEAAIWAVGFDRSGDTMMTASEDGVVHIWDAPPNALEGDVNQIVLWTQVMTGLELDDDGAIRVLDSDDWHRRRERLRRNAAFHER